MTHFRSENRMRGRAGALLGLFSCVFIGMGVAFRTMLPPETRDVWPGVFHLAFLLVGFGALAIVIYGVAKTVSFYTYADGSVIEWGCSNRARLVGRVNMADLARLIYTEGIDAGFEMVLVEKSGKTHSLVGEYLFSDRDAKRLVSFVQQNFPAIEVIRN